MRSIFCVLLLFVPIAIFADDLDSVRVVDLEKVVIRTSYKETNAHGRTPSAMSTITPSRIDARDIDGVKRISSIVPNFFIPDYGSPLSTPIYIRGIGTRGSGQSVGIYVDDVPMLDKSTFDVQLSDMERIEVLRGPQGTLYGRNAMGGVINIYTRNPLDYQGTRLELGAASYDNYNVRGSHFMKIGADFGVGVSGYFNSAGGYFKNIYTGSRTDKRQDAGGKLKLAWDFAPLWRATLSAAYDWTNGGAFAYGAYDKTTGEVSPVNFNDRASYFRETSNNSLRFEHNGAKVLFTSATSYQYLRDNMYMDQDFTSQKIFTINQQQHENGISQELTWRSNDNKNYQWSVGAYGFFTDLKTIGNVNFGPDGVKQVLQAVMPPMLTILDNDIANPGVYRTPTWGVAIYHQSTFNNLITKGLSLTVGLRFDYEKQYIDYSSQLGMNVQVKAPGMPRPITMYAADTVSGGQNQGFFKVLPRISLSYECSPNISTWVTVSKGYRAGGYNVQMFSEVLQQSLQAKFNPKAEQVDLNQMISYKPEVTWNYELGARGRFLNGLLTAEFALFYMDVANVQLTQFVAGGSGRILSNAGHGSSCGVELSASVRPISGLVFDVSYGFTNAKFLDYDNGKTSFKGKSIPYTPNHTFTIGGMYNLDIKGFIDNFQVSASFNGAGKIYWTESNDIAQPFYGTLDAKASIAHASVRLEIWARNILDAKYNAFYFESFSRSYMQQGRPMTFGANVVLTF